MSAKNEAPDLAALIAGLEIAEKTADPRESAGQALLAVWQLLGEIPEIRARGLDAPIFALILALDDLSKSAVAPMLKGGKSPNGPQAPTARRIMKAYCSHMAGCLISAGYPVDKACKIVAAALNGSTILKGDHALHWQKVKNWRDGASKLDQSNQERAVLDVLRAEAADVEASPEHVTARIQWLHKQIGRFG